MMIEYIWAVLGYLLKKREYPDVHSIISNLKEEEKLSSNKWEQLLNSRLGNIIDFASQHVPYYQKQFDAVGIETGQGSIRDNVSRLPLLTKKDIQNNINALIADNVEGTDLIENATGGSTGVPLKFYQNLHYLTIGVAIDAIVRDWWDIRPYDKTAQLWGADIDFHELSLKGKIYHALQRTKALNAFRMTEDSLLDFSKMLEKWKPPYLMGYSTALETLAHQVKKHDELRFSLKAIRSTAETLYPHQRSLIEEALQAPVYNFYGSREVNNIAAECPEEGRMHLISTYRYVEIVDEQGKRVPDGEPGYVAVTDLSNFAMPFIRYKNEDIARMSKTPCPCGRPSPVIEELMGRSSDLIITKRKEIIHGEFFTHLFYGTNDIRQFQVHQKTLKHLIIRYVSVKGPLDDFMQDVAEKIREKIGQDVQISIELCKEIPIPKSGKHRFTISDVKPF